MPATGYIPRPSNEIEGEIPFTAPEGSEQIFDDEGNLTGYYVTEDVVGEYYVGARSARDFERWKHEYPGARFDVQPDGTIKIYGKQVTGQTRKYVPRPLSAKERTDKTKLEELEQEYLDRITNTPAEYVSAAEEEAKAYGDYVRKGLGEAYGKDIQVKQEDLSRRGLYGSRAFVDIMKESEKNKLAAEADIANRTTAMRQDLIERRGAQDINMFNIIKGLQNYDEAMAFKKQQAGLQFGLAGEGMDLQRRQMDLQELMSRYKIDAYKKSTESNFWNDIQPFLQTGVGLAYIGGQLWGGNKNRG